jgi:hypothetical protein
LGKSPKPKQWGFGPEKGATPMSEKDNSNNQGRAFFDIDIEAFKAMSQREQILFAGSLREAIISSMVSDQDDSTDSEVDE